MRGSTEGRLLAERLAGSNVRADVFVATEYGKEEIPEAPNLHVYDGRIDENGMEDLFREKRYDLILDATHPFAKAVTANIREAAKKTDTAFLRILRDGGRSGIRVQTLEEIQEMAADRKNEPVFVDSVRTAVEFLKMTEGRSLSRPEVRNYLRFWSFRTGRRESTRASSRCRML